MNGDKRLLHINSQKQKPQDDEKVASEDVLSDILIRLPAKQLARLRCVSKRWNRLISQPCFIKSHLIRNKNKDNEILLVLTFSHSLEVVITTAHPARAPDIQLNDIINLPANFPLYTGYWRVLGCVNGLICFICGPSYLTCDIYIWNPSLSAVIRLPDFTWPSSSCSCSCFCFGFRFGFDPKSDDYKVVKVTLSDLQVEVYSMRKGTWRLISESFPSRVLGIRQSNKVDDGNGHVYWLCWNDIDSDKHHHQRIVAFDLGAEKFFEISLPGGRSLNESKSCIIFKDLYLFTGKLCVTSYDMEDDRVADEVWVMNEYRVTESWVKHNVLLHANWNIDILGFTLNNEVYFREEPCCDHLALYDPDTTKVKYFDHCHVTDQTHVVQYVDSLVWI